MDFSQVQAMSFSGRPATQAWIAGTKVWSAPASAYYFPFRLIKEGSYLSYNDFMSESWDIIRLNDDMWSHEINFSKNQVLYVTDENNRTVFYLPATDSAYANGAYVYLTTDTYEYSNGNLQTPSTASTLAALTSAGINNITGFSLAVDEVLLSINDGTYTWNGGALPVAEYLNWEISAPDISSTPIFTGSNTCGPGSVINVPWGNDISVVSVPCELWGLTIEVDYKLWSSIAGSSSPFTGTLWVAIPDATGQGPVNVLVNMPSITDP